MNNIIKPHYVDFNTAKLLKEKRLVADCKKYWVKYTDTEYKEMSDIQLEDLDREIGIGGNLVIPKYEQWQVVEWLRVNHGIWVYSYPIHPFNSDEDDGYPKTVWISKIISTNYVFQEKFIDSDNGLAVNHHNSPQEAYSAAFDYIRLNNLI